MEPQTAEAKSLARACETFLKDLEALPEEAFDKSFGPKVRTVADIVFEVNLVNDHIGRNVRGEQQPAWPDEGWIKAPDDLKSKDAVIESFRKGTEKLVETFSPLSPEQMAEEVATDHGPRTKAERCRFVTLHTWYHSGQLNFIQTLLGDDGWHW